MNKFYKIQNYCIYSLPRDITKVPMCFQVFFLHLMAGVIEGNKHILIYFRMIEKTNT